MASDRDEWFADESIWKDLYPFTFPESAFAVADEQVERILRLTGVGGGKVLDLCCGPGRHAVALAKRGFAVTAVDRTRFLLEHARTRVGQANLIRRVCTRRYAALQSSRDLRPDHQFLYLVRVLCRPGGRFARARTCPREPQAWWGLRTGNGK